MEPPRNIHQWAKGHSSFLRKKKSTIIDVEGMEYNSERPKIVPKKLVNITSGMLPFLVAINLNVIFQKN